MSAGLAKQMETLEEKLSTLSNGTEGNDSSFAMTTVGRTALIKSYLAVAAVLSNWHSVLRAINLASGNLFVD